MINIETIKLTSIKKTTREIIFYSNTCHIQESFAAHWGFHTKSPHRTPDHQLLAG